MHQHQELHWLDIPERVNYKLRVLTHRCLLGKASVYLSNCCIPVSQVASRRHLLSAARHQLTVPRHRLSTYGRRAFAAAGPTMFNTLPDDLRDPAVSTETFGQSLKTNLSAYQPLLRSTAAHDMQTKMSKSVEISHSCVCVRTPNSVGHISPPLLVLYADNYSTRSLGL